jgi:hypothetical protein
MTTERETKFDWPLCYEAENDVLRAIDAFLERNNFARTLGQRMRDETGTLFIDWVDHFLIPAAAEQELRARGYEDDPLGEAPAQRRVLWHPEAMLPRVLVDANLPGSDFPPLIALRVDSIADFMAVHAIIGKPEGEPLTRFRKVIAASEGGATLAVIERRGYRGYVEGRVTRVPNAASYSSGESDSCNSSLQLLKAHELWRTRPRRLPQDRFAETHALIDELVRLVGRDLACHVVFAEERVYWERRNRAGQVQKRRQDALGLGWSNHDHHTFRSSREHFVDLMTALEKLGFERRERYYAGAQAGWGAQILEQSVEGIVAFCDVDLQPEETEIDFSRRPLPPSKKLGTIGLWVGLHGESFLDAGMHHLECRFDYALLREQLAAHNVNTMNPFSDLPFLKQAFTEGERWPVQRERAERLLSRGLIDQAQFDKFITEGAIGSHLENLQRKGGFKGFNQKSVSVIIQATDPRQAQLAAPQHHAA